jgi:sodium pump decarboxylase gamma subunit
MAQNLETALYLMVIGMGVVFASLVLLQAFTSAIGAFDRLLRRLGAGPAPPATPAPLSAEAVQDEEAAVIAAAVAAALARRVEVHHIRMLHDENMETWSRVGRLDIMRSHDRGSGRT